jgi:MFS family permease
LLQENFKQSSKLPELKKPVESPILASDKPGPYAYMVLLFVLLVRICYCVNKNSIGYAYGYQGIGIQANNPVFELQTAFPKIKEYYGIIASLMFSVAYAVSNIFMSDLSKGWNKKWMLGIGVLGFASSSLVAGVTNSLLIFALMRFTFGAFASAINAPIY